MIDTVEAFKVLKHYGIHTVRGKTGHQAGTDVAIAGRTDPDGKRFIDACSATHGAERMIPLDAAGAEFLATNFQAHHHHGTSEAARRMLEHLLLRVSALFEHSGISEFFLTVRLYESSYTVVDASMKAPRALHLKERLDAHAHDRKSTGYHSAGRE